MSAPQPAYAIGTSVGLGTAASYSVLGGQSVSNTGASVLSGDLGVNPGSEISGFPPGTFGGDLHATDAHSGQAQADLTTAYNNAAGQDSDAAIGSELGGLTLAPGVYTADSSTQITGPLTLDAEGDPAAVFIFQIGSALTTASSSSVLLLNGAQSCHVFWQVASSATLGTDSTFVGTIMALTSISADTGATVKGRALARNGSVTLDTNVFTDPRCTDNSSPSATATPTPTPTVTATDTGTPTATATVSATTSPTSTASVIVPVPTPTDSATVAGAGDNSPGDTSGEDLAFTGGGLSAPLLGLAGTAALVGIAMMIVARRRRAN